MRIGVALAVGIGLLITSIIGTTACTPTPSDEIVIGVVLPISGGMSTYGDESWRGLQMAFADVLIDGKKVKLQLQDNGSVADQSKTAAQTLINQHGALALIGAVASGNTKQAGLIAKSEGVPILSPASTNENLPQEIGDVFFRVCYHDGMQGDACARAAMIVIGQKNLPKTAAVLVDSSQLYSTGLATSFEAAFTKLGGQIVEKQSYTSTDSQFDAQINAIAQKRPGAIFIPGYYGEVGNILKAAAEKWQGIPIFGGDGWDSPVLAEQAGPALSRLECYICTHFVADDPAARVKEFVDRYKAQPGVTANPGAMAALGYDAGLVMIDALKRAAAKGPLTREAIKNALRETKEIEGVTGTITIDAVGNAIKALVIAKVTPQGFSFSGIDITQLGAATDPSATPGNTQPEATATSTGEANN